MERRGAIYKIENILNGKVYIGQTVRKYERRMYEHKRKLKSGCHDNFFIQNAWNKHGEKAFKFSLIEECEFGEIDKKEVEWISFYRERNLSYNLESGGKNHKTLHDSTKEKLSARTKSLGWVGDKHPRARKIICIDTRRIYNSMIEASEELGLSYGGLYNVLSGKNNCVKGKDNQYYQFSYIEESKECSLKEIDYSTIKKPKKVICINTGEIFNSTREASEKMGVGQAKVSLCCNNKREHTGFYQFAFYEEGKKYKLKELENKRTPKKVICLNTGEIFNTTREAAEKTGVQQPGISLCCNGKRSYSGKLSDGTKLKWKFC